MRQVVLHVGETLFDVQQGAGCSFDQELISIGQPARGGDQVDMHRLGKLNERVVVTPNIDSLFEFGGR